MKVYIIVAHDVDKDNIMCVCDTEFMALKMQVSYQASNPSSNYTIDSHNVKLEANE